MRWIVLLLLALLPISLMAQTATEAPEASEEDKGRLATFIEDQLSGAGREVEVIGLRGALSSQATLQELRISDDTGIWLTMSGVTLNWNRLAVLAGNFDVNQLKADKIVLTRIPTTTADPEAPKAEATPFALPELPVSINVADLSATRIELGEAVLGEALTLSLQARLILAGGDGGVLLNATRLDGASGHFLIDAAYSNTTRDLRLDLNASEASGGIVTTLAGIPGAPAIELTTLGAGPIDDFTADIRLASDGQDRLTGQVVLSAEPDQIDTEALVRTVQADLRGDIAPLFDDEFRRFFGSDIGLTTFARLFPDGRVTLENLALWTAALNLTGDLELAATGMPRQFGLNLRMRDPDGAPMLLPVAGDPIQLNQANLTASFDADEGDRWTLDGTLSGLDAPAIGLTKLGISGHGLINRDAPRKISADLLLNMAGLRMEDAGFAEAVGSDGTLSANLIWNEGADLEVSAFELLSGGLVARGNATLSGLSQSLAIDGKARLLVPDATRFAALSGRDVSGEVSAEVSGKFATLDRAFDGQAFVRSRDLAIGEPQIDALIKGEATVTVSAARDFDGLTLRDFTAKSDAIDAGAQGALSSAAGDLSFFAKLTDVALVVPDIAGPASLRGRAQMADGDWSIDAAATGPADTSVTVLAALPRGGGGKADFDLEIARVETFLPTLPGRARVSGSAEQDGPLWQVALDATGPFDSTLNGAGTVDLQGNKNAVKLTGSLPLAVANRALSPNSIQGTAQLDMALNGALDPKNLSGTVSIGGARMAMPELRMAFNDIGGTVTLRESTAAVDFTTAYSGGGQIAVNGTVGLTAPFNANLPVQLINITHQEGRLLKTSVDGTIALSGPLTGGGQISGDLVVGQTDIRIIAGALGGVGSIPDIVHVGELGGSLATRTRAGVIKDDKQRSGGSRPFGLGINVRTGERINVSGLGLNADFEGGLTIGGTTANIVPEGGLELIRGRMNFVGKTLELEEGRVALAGGFVPTVRIVAISEQSEATIRLIVDGFLEDPDIELTSDPELPEDEVLSQLLFGRDIANISPIQAIQLARAVASMSGGGGGGGLFSLGVESGGGVGLTTGGYLSENLYTEIGVDSKGKSSIDLNIDLNEKITIKGRVNSDSETGIGIFYQRDY
ncbi:MAG: translocation/assembly module TamB domain-containing protein [Shimia sp.]|uniref:translocation/assembly module TamB domain-containing protein n=1 Tax=Shimia sp. TaxID=1954381 RepID=UPI004058FB9E